MKSLPVALARVCLSFALAGSLALATDQTVDGNLSVTGDADIGGTTFSLGTRTDSSTVPGLNLLYGDATAPTIYFSATRNTANWLWQSNISTPQLKLSSTNQLLLYDQGSTPTAGITLDPAGASTFNHSVEVTGDLMVTGGTLIVPSVTLPDGSILTSARSTTLYNAAGEAVATVASDDKINFANGFSIGTDPAAIITGNSAAYLTQTLANLGFQESSVTPTHVRDLALSGDINIKAAVSAGTFTYVVGYARGTCDIGGMTIWASSDYSSGFIAKLPHAGGTAGCWIRIVAGSQLAELYSVAVDVSGNVFAGGKSDGGITNVAGTNGVNFSPAGRGGLCVKLNSLGVAQWAKPIGDVIYSIAVDVSGNVFTGGSFYGTIYNVAGTSGINASQISGADGLVVKLNGSGVAQWAKVIGGTSADQIISIAVDASGNVFAGGTFSGTINNVAGISGVNFISAGWTDVLIVKLDGSGVAQWARTIGNTGLDNLSSIAVDTSGNVFAGGRFSGTINNVAGTSGVNVISAGPSADGLIVKLNSSGVAEWAKAIGSDFLSNDSLSSIAVDASGNVFTGGGFSGTINNIAGTSGVNVVSAGSSVDGLIVKFNSSGIVQWAQALGGTENDQIENIAINGDGLMIWGTLGYAPWAIGDAVLAPRGTTSFACVLSSSDIVTTPLGHPAALAWGSGLAKNEGVALGAGSYASGTGSAAVGTGIANASNAFSSGSGQSMGIASTAMGSSTNASGYSATATGNSTQASGDNATAMGQATVASGYNAIAMGQGTVASGYNATAMGQGTVASGYSATAIGFSTNASGDSAIAMGEGTNASGYSATAMGFGTAASGASAATAMGWHTTASGDSSTAMGNYTSAEAYRSTVVGALNVAQGSATEWIPTDDLFVIGNGIYDDFELWEQSNAFVVHKNGDARVAGTLQVKGGIRVAPSGDISMGDFHAGDNPATLGNGLRYENE